jgi:hypothetical protein
MARLHSADRRARKHALSPARRTQGERDRETGRAFIPVLATKASQTLTRVIAAAKTP